MKLFTIAPMYRYGRPGRGRYREHWQLSLEAIGSPGPEIDAEVIQFYAALLGRLGVTEWELHLNSIGDAACRPAYVERLNAWLDAHPELATEEVGHKRATSPLQVFDVKDERLREALADAPKIGESLCDACQEHFDAVRRLLDALRRAVRRSTRCSCAGSTTTRAPRSSSSGPEENVNSTICGGGRYDGLVEAVGGPPTPGIGFGAGLERLMLAIEREAPEQPERARSTSSSRVDGGAARAGARADGRAARARDRRATPTTRAARSRASSRRPGRTRRARRS